MSCPSSQHLVSVYDVDETEKHSISDLLYLLKRSFRCKDFEWVEWILKMREGKMNMAKEEAEMCAVHLEKELRIYKAKCVELSMELEKKKKKEIKDLEFNKIGIEDECKGHKRMCDELKETIKRLEEDREIVCERERRAQKRIASLSDEIKNMSREEAHRFVELKTENRDLECAKRRAENEIECWQKKFRDLTTLFLKEPQVQRKVYVEPRDLSNKSSYAEEGKKVESRLSNIKSEAHSEDNGACTSNLAIKEEVPSFAINQEVLYSDGGVCDSVNANSIFHPPVRGNGATQVSESGMENGSRGRNQIKLELDGSSHKKLFEATIEISDSDSDMEATSIENSSVVLKRTCLTQNGEENKNYCKHFSVASTAKRKVSPNVVTNCSDGEDDHDYNDIPKMKAVKELTFGVHYNSDSSHNQHCLVPTVSSGVDDAIESSTLKRRRLVSLRQCEEKRRGAEQIPSDHFAISGSSYKKLGKLTAWKDNEDEAEFRSDCVSESVDRCIIARSDGSGRDVNSTISEHEDGISKFLCAFRRLKGTKMNWNYEADMIASFEKDPLLCIKAVCALYRQHNSEEPSTKGSLHSDSRGFSKLDAVRGTSLANFLMDGNGEGDIKKSVKDLEMHDPKGLEECKRLAKYYSKQLFTIYKNKEDPFFLPASMSHESIK